MKEETEAVFYNRLFLLESPYLQFLQTTAPLTPLMTDCLTYLEEVEEATGTSFPVFPICLEARSLAKEEANQVTRLQDHQDQDPPMVLQQLDHHTRLLLPITGNISLLLQPWIQIDVPRLPSSSYGVPRAPPVGYGVPQAPPIGYGVPQAPAISGNYKAPSSTSFTTPQNNNNNNINSNSNNLNGFASSDSYQSQNRPNRESLRVSFIRLVF